MVASTTVADAPDHVAAGGLWVAATARHFGHTTTNQDQTTRPLAQEQLEMQNQNPVPTECALLSHHRKSGLSGT